MTSIGDDKMFSDLPVSPAQRSVIRRQLEEVVSNHEDQGVRDIMRGVLNGKASLRSAILGERLADKLDDAARPYLSWYRDLSDEERAEQVNRGNEYAEELRQQDAAAQAGVWRARPSPPEDDWETPRSILKKRRPRR